MPILHIKALPQKDNGRVNTALKKVSLALAECCNCDPRHVWATWEEIKPGWYVEGDKDSFVQPASTHPPIGELIMFEGASLEQIEEALELTSKVLCEALDLEDNMFLTYREAKSGQVIAGNGIIRKL